MSTLSPSPLLHVVLHQPDIPNNTGNIGRTCVSLGAALHLIHPLGFDLSVKACRRAGLDYWPRLPLSEYESFADYSAQTTGARRWIFSTHATRPMWEVPFQPGDHLVFGSETAGLPDAVMQSHTDYSCCLPMLGNERSLNLATVVCTALYEAIRQLAHAGVIHVDETGRLVL